MNKVLIASFYKFVPLDDFESLQLPLVTKMRQTNIKGTIILAKEGINGSVAGSYENVQAYYQILRQDLRFADLHFKETFDDVIPFAKAKVKLRKEIVTMGAQCIDPVQNSGVYLSPEEWHELIQDPEVILIDTRNDYEFKLGTFKQAINPNTANFRDFPDYVHHHLSEKKDKKIAMFCTGGIRCEKSTAFLKAHGFKNVFHLKDGILNYLAQIPEEKSLWEGDCFVFDERVAVNAQLKRVTPQLPQDYKEQARLILGCLNAT